MHNIERQGGWGRPPYGGNRPQRGFIRKVDRKAVAGY